MDSNIFPFSPRTLQITIIQFDEHIFQMAWNYHHFVFGKGSGRLLFIAPWAHGSCTNLLQKGPKTKNTINPCLFLHDCFFVNFPGHFLWKLSQEEIEKKISRDHNDRSVGTNLWHVDVKRRSKDHQRYEKSWKVGADEQMISGVIVIVWFGYRYCSLFYVLFGFGRVWFFFDLFCLLVCWAVLYTILTCTHACNQCSFT